MGILFCVTCQLLFHNYQSKILRTKVNSLPAVFLLTAVCSVGRLMTWLGSMINMSGLKALNIVFLCSNTLTYTCCTCRYKIIKASVGRNHTVVVTDDGKSFSFGHNKHGQLGTGSLRNGWYPLSLISHRSACTYLFSNIAGELRVISFKIGKRKEYRD